MIGGTVGQRLGVVGDRRPPPDALLDTARRLGARLATLAHDRIHQRGAFAADVRAAAGARAICRRLAGAEDVLAEQSQRIGLLDGVAEALDRHDVLAADVVVAAPRADRDAGDHDAFEHHVRIALDKPAVLVDVRLALVRVADDVLGLGARLTAALPLDAGREARAATAAHIGGLDLFDDLFLRHLEERLDVGGIAVARDVFLDRVWIDHAGVLEQHALLAREKRMLLEQRHARSGASPSITPMASSLQGNPRCMAAISSGARSDVTLPYSIGG